MDSDFQDLMDEVKIHRLFTQYAMSVDRRDWKQLQSLFAQKIKRDLSSFSGVPEEVINSEQHVSECQLTLPGFDSTQHFLLNHDISVNGDEAKAIVYVIADHTLVEEGAQKQFTIRGYYTFGFERTEAGWIINSIALQVESTQGDQAIFAIASQRASKLV